LPAREDGMRELYVSADERQALEQMAQRDPKPYRRERATALLKIAAGQPAAVVARSGLLRPRDPDTLYSWLDRYEADGLAGLTIAPGRGRKPAFVPPAVQHPGGGPGQLAGAGGARPAGVLPDGQPLDAGQDPERVLLHPPLHAGRHLAGVAGAAGALAARPRSRAQPRPRVSRQTSLRGALLGAGAGGGGHAGAAVPR
jgi:hypothetical protein